MYEMNRRNNGYNPFREMEELQKQFFADPFARYDESDSMAEFRTDVIDEGDHFLLQADLPGFAKDNIHLSLDGNTLTIEAERQSRVENAEDKKKFLRCERSYGTYSRKFSLHEIDTDQIRAAYENGVLALILPKKQPKMPTARTLTIE